MFVHLKKSEIVRANGGERNRGSLYVCIHRERNILIRNFLSIWLKQQATAKEFIRAEIITKHPVLSRKWAYFMEEKNNNINIRSKLFLTNENEDFVLADVVSQLIFLQR